MHDTAALTGKIFFECYGYPGCKILDVGSLNLNGSLRQFRPSMSKYTGIDLQAGPGVDLVITDPYHLPFNKEEFDLVVSTSCLEHDRFFWLTFLEMVRVTSPNGFIYVSVPSDGKIHRYPIDCWRFYPDAAQALAEWSSYSGMPLSVIETFYMNPIKDVWTDNVMVFGRPDVNKPKSIMRYLSEQHNFTSKQMQVEQG